MAKWTQLQFKTFHLKQNQSENIKENILYFTTFPEYFPSVSNFMMLLQAIVANIDFVLIWI
jgi:hypothetical protein